MVLGIGKMFSRSSTDNENIAVVEPSFFTIAQSRELYYHHLLPKDSTQKLTVPQTLVVDMVTSDLQKKDMRVKAVPRLPMVIPKLLKSLRDPNSSARHYVEIINKYPVMSAAVLKLANSVYFNPISKRINDIEPAVIKLGIDGLRSVLSAAVMQPIIQRESPYFSQTGAKMWQHSLHCAVACELIAEHRGMEKFKVYVMGLIHDIGKITVFSELCNQFKKHDEHVAPGYNAFVPSMKKMSDAVSYLVAKDWELPKDVCRALAEQAKVKNGEKISPYAMVLYQANLLAETYATVRTKNERLASRVLEALSLPADIYEKLDMLGKEL